MLDLNYSYLHDKTCDIIKYFESRYGIECDEAAVEVVRSYMHGVVLEQITRDKKGEIK